MILIVDSDPEIIERAREILNHDRHVLAVSSVKHALAMVRRLGFSVVLVDLELPDDPLTLIQELHATNPDIAIIGITAAVHPEIPAGSKSLGVTEILRKPISLAWKPVVERVLASRGCD
ncbi:MAG TPA: response regulator [Bryobacteraceae bacterium]|jgi:CheY-like chemotaxis protein|nr:response regulator [Bryobacteraceae bacterium]